MIGKLCPSFPYSIAINSNEYSLFNDWDRISITSLWSHKIVIHSRIKFLIGYIPLAVSDKI